MDAIQFERWNDFTKNMIYAGLGNITQARKDKLWSEAESFIYGYRNEPVDGWDDEYCLCDDFREHFVEYINDIWDDRAGWQKESQHYFANQLEIVIRAGVNVACESDHAGVIGFTVGDLRTMYAGEIPEWITAQYEGMDAAEDATGVLL
jgi:hypothetical protein